MEHMFLLIFKNRPFEAGATPEQIASRCHSCFLVEKSKNMAAAVWLHVNFNIPVPEGAMPVVFYLHMSFNRIVIHKSVPTIHLGIGIRLQFHVVVLHVMMSQTTIINKCGAYVLQFLPALHILACRTQPIRSNLDAPPIRERCAALAI